MFPGTTKDLEVLTSDFAEQVKMIDGDEVGSNVWTLPDIGFLKRFLFATSRGVFKTMLNVEDEAFCENYFRKTFHLRYLTGLWIQL